MYREIFNDTVFSTRTGFNHTQCKLLLGEGEVDVEGIGAGGLLESSLGSFELLEVAVSTVCWCRLLKSSKRSSRKGCQLRNCEVAPLSLDAVTFFNCAIMENMHSVT